MSTPKITVYLAAHNYGRFLADAIESVLRQKRDDWELIVIDDASSDETPDIVARYTGDPRIRAFRTPGIGLPKVCNLALAEARGDYLIRLDGDDVFDENILLVLGAWLDAEPDLALVFPDYFLMDELGEIFAHERREAISQKNHLLDMPPNGACTLVRKSVLEAVGGYREDLGAQDGFDLWTKLVKGYKSANVNLPLFYYRRHGQNLTNNNHRILSARRRIKKDAIETSLDSFKPLIAVIPCRQNYDFCQNVWQQELGGKTLLQHDLEACLQSSILDHIVVASDNPDVQHVLARYDDARLKYFARKPADTIRSKSLVPTLEKIAEEWDPQLKGVAVISYIQAPFVTTGTLEEAIYTLAMNGTDSSVGVEEIDDPIYKRTPHGLQPVNPPRHLATDFDRVYREANTALATRTRNFKTGSLTGPAVVNFIVSHDECFFINSERTLKTARIMVEER
jgi:CMP-N-acetylneuraminic acid synthetase